MRRMTSSLTMRSRERLRFQADVERHVKEDGLDLVAEAGGHLDPLAALVRREVGGIHVVPGHLGDQASAQQRTQGGKDQALVALFFDVVEEDVAEQIAGQRRDAAAAEPGGFARAGQGR